ncbi:MAG: DNA ligase, partial [archaeon]|nr:DNA ligase [archaeon]
ISQRIKRKYDIHELSEKLPVEVNVFDILFYNGKPKLETPFKKRAELIREIIKEHPYKLISSKMKITNNEKEVKEFYKEALENNQEGIMLKNLDAHYKPGRRVGNMLKLKPEENELDLVITGGEWGTGKRSGWISSFILSCKKNGKYLEIGKVGTGIGEKINDENKVTFDELTKLMVPIIIEEKGKDIKVKPKIIVTVHYQDIQKSPNYASGWALRFPRITALRPDKPLSEIATLDEIEKDFVVQREKNYKYG